jgi:hypothetical protein
MFPLRKRGLVERAQTGFPDMVYRHRAGFGKARQNPGSLRHFEREDGRWRSSARATTTIFSCASGIGALALPLTGDREASMASLDHIIVLMLENNSFDRMLGALFPERIGGGGIKGTAANHWNDDTSPTPKPPIRHVMQPTIARTVTPDPMHEYPNVVTSRRVRTSAS